MKGLHPCGVRDCIRTENTTHCDGCGTWLCLTHRHKRGSAACEAQEAWTRGSAALNALPTDFLELDPPPKPKPRTRRDVKRDDLEWRRSMR